MAKHLIDLSQAARYAGNADDITEIANGSPANADTFNAPPQDLRERLETLRQEVEDLKWTVDADRAMSLTVAGTLSVSDDYGYKLVLTGSGSLSLQPFNGKQSYATGTLTLSSTARMTLTASSDATGPRGWGQYNGGFGPAERGANNIQFTFILGSSLQVSVVDDQVTVTVPASTTVSALVTYLNSSDRPDTYKNLKISAAASSGQEAYAITISSTLVVPLSGANEPSQATVTKAQLDTFFNTAANRLEDGDCLAIYFPETVSAENGGVGRRQVVTSTVLSGNLFNTRVEPSKIPLSLPIAVRRGTNVILCDGAMVPVDGSLANDRYLRTTGGTVTGDLGVVGDVQLEGDFFANSVDAATITGQTATLGTANAADGSLTVHRDDTNGTAIEVKKAGVSKFKVDSEGDVTVEGDLVVKGAVNLGDGTDTITVKRLLTVGTSDGSVDGTVVINTDAASTTALAVTNDGFDTFKVTSDGDVTAATLTLGGVAVPVPSVVCSVDSNTVWYVDSALGGASSFVITENFAANSVTLGVGTYLVTAHINYLSASTINGLYPIDVGVYGVSSSTTPTFSSSKGTVSSDSVRGAGNLKYSNTMTIASGGHGSISVSRLFEVTTAGAYSFYPATYMSPGSSTTSTNLGTVTVQMVIQRVIGA